MDLLCIRVVTKGSRNSAVSGLNVDKSLGIKCKIESNLSKCLLILMLFLLNRNLKRHYLIHTDEKPYSCEWPGCEARFRVGSSLNRHKLVHRVGADFVCDWPQCGKRLRSKGYYY